MMDARKELYEVCELFGKTVLWTCARIDRGTIPDGLYVYDLRDECDGIPYEVAPVVYVNHFGTIISKEPIEMKCYGAYSLIGEEDYNFIGNDMTLEQYIGSLQADA